MTKTKVEPYVLLDDNTGSGAPSALYEQAVEIVRADTPADVPSALARLEAASLRRRTLKVRASA